MNRMIAANSESRILERIAAAVGYEGQYGDDLIAVVEAMTSNAEENRQLARLRSLLQLPGAPLARLVDQVEHIVAALNAGNDVDADLVTANASLFELEAKIDQIRAALDADEYPGLDLAAKVGNLVDSCRSYRKWINSILDAVGKPGMHVGDVAEYCKDLAALARYAQPVAMELRSSARPMESYILDLSLMVLRGEVVGLDPDFIGAMREAV